MTTNAVTIYLTDISLYLTIISVYMYIYLTRLIVPGLGSDRIYIVDVKSDPRNPNLDKVEKKQSTDFVGSQK